MSLFLGQTRRSDVDNLSGTQRRGRAASLFDFAFGDAGVEISCEHHGQIQD
jgi:hypothetical protein